MRVGGGQGPDAGSYSMQPSSVLPRAWPRWLAVEWSVSHVQQGGVGLHERILVQQHTPADKQKRRHAEGVRDQH